MSLQVRLQEDLKDAMRKGDSLRRTVIRSLLSGIHNAELAKRGGLADKEIARRTEPDSEEDYVLSDSEQEEIGKQAKLDDEGMIAVLTKQAQQHRDSIEAFAKGGRDDLVEKEKAELALIMGYLPQQMSNDEIRAVVQSAIEAVGAQGPGDMGKVMGRVMPQVRGKADGREVNAIASEMLKGLEG